jgi:hypothetical protein
MRDRTEIRVMVRGGEPLVERVEKVAKTLKTIELFDPFNRQHLLRIDDRMNQNFLVGSAMQYIDAGLQPFARGATLSQALVALVPRALWPDKTVYAGSMGLVSNYTGITFAYGTSVGMGQVFEFYVNFGTTGIILGFLILGAALGVVDQAARDRLENGNWLAFTLWYLPGIAFLQAGGSLIEISSGGGAAVVTALLVNRGLLWGMRGKRMTDPLGRSVVGRA